MMAKSVAGLMLGAVFALSLAGCADTTSMDTASMPAKSIPLTELKTLFPESIGKGKPVIVDAYSKLCLDCKKLAPKLDDLAAKQKGILVRRVDIQQPKGNDRDIIKALGIVTVPHVAFITAKGDVKATYVEDAPMAKLEESAQLTQYSDLEKEP